MMPKPRMQWLWCLAAAILAADVLAQEFPAKSIRVIVPFAPGGVVDTLGRTLAPHLGKGLGQSVVIENRPGGNTVIGSEIVLRAPADGHTILMMAPSFTVNPFVQAKLPFDPLKDFAPVTRIASNPLVICAHPSLPVKTVKELVALARKHPGQLTWGVSSIVGGGRLAGEIFFRDFAKVELTNVPYGSGAPLTTAVLGGHTIMLIGNVIDCVSYVSSGRMRAIAVTSAKRSEALKDVPTIAESGYPGFDEINWFGVVVRAGAPRSAVQRLGAEVARALSVPEVTESLARLGLSPAALTPEQFDAFIRAEMTKNGKIIKALNLKVE